MQRLGRARQIALTRTPKEWKKLRNRASVKEDWYIYNAYFELSKALDKRRIIDIEAWEYILAELQKNTKTKYRRVKNV